MAESIWATLLCRGPVSNTRHAQRALLLLSGLRDVDSPDVRRSISLAVNGLKHLFNPDPEALLRLRHRLPIHPGAELVGI
jgi:hypothetical protein